MIDEWFWINLAKIAEIRWWLHEPVEVNRLADGSVIPASLGAGLWRGDATLRPHYHREQQAVEARLNRLIRPGMRFLAHDPRQNGPAADPGGVILGASEPAIHSIQGSNNRHLRINGLPPGYVISDGDYIGVAYGASPVRRALHQVVFGASASGGGLTGLIEVTPHIRPGMAAGDAVTLVQPQILAQLLGSEHGHGRPVIAEGARIEFIQVLK